MFEFLHVTSLALTVPCILYADHMGAQYLFGKQRTLPAKPVSIVHKAVFIGLTLMIITGIGLTLPAWDYYIADPVFQLKMFFVAVLVVNGLFIGRLMHNALHTPFAKLTTNKKVLLLASGAASAIGWVSTIVIGYVYL